MVGIRQGPSLRRKMLVVRRDMIGMHRSLLDYTAHHEGPNKGQRQYNAEDDALIGGKHYLILIGSACATLQALIADMTR